jgi:hypothetical protein
MFGLHGQGGGGVGMEGYSQVCMTHDRMIWCLEHKTSVESG